MLVAEILEEKNELMGWLFYMVRSVGDAGDALGVASETRVRARWSGLHELQVVNPNPDEHQTAQLRG